MSKALLFYVIDEYVDIENYCKKKRLIPYKTETKMLDKRPYEQVVQYIKDGYVYDVLEGDECYSGYMLTLVRRPYLAYEELLKLALESKKYDERAGAIGIILKKYPLQFEYFLTKMLENVNKKMKLERKQIKMVQYINHVVKENTSYVHKHEKLLTLCEEIECGN